MAARAPDTAASVAARAPGTSNAGAVPQHAAAGAVDHRDDNALVSLGLIALLALALPWAM